MPIDAVTSVSRAYLCPPGENIAEAAAFGIPDEARARTQYLRVADALRNCGVDVISLPSLDAPAEGCLMGAMAVVTENLAVLGTSQGPAAATALAGDRFVKFITPPGTLSANDVLRIGNHFYIGVGDTTNHEGAAQLGFFLTEYGYEATVIETGDGLHLGEAVTVLDNATVLIREELVRHYAFLTFERIIVPHADRGATNALMVNGTLIMPAGYAEIASVLRTRGHSVIEVNVSEYEKMDAGLKKIVLCAPKAAQVGPAEITLLHQKIG